MTSPLEARRQILEGLGEHEQAAAHPPFEAFLGQVRSRLDRGREVFQERSLDRTGPELLTEIQEELADVAGWSALLWSRLERLRHELRRIDPGPERGRASPTAPGDASPRTSETSRAAPGDVLDRLEAEVIAEEEAERTALEALMTLQSDPEREHAARIFGGRRE